MDMARKLAAEAIGTAFLLIAVVGSGIMAERLAGGNVALALLGNTLATRQVMRRGVDGMIGFVLPLSTAGLLAMLALSPWPGVFTILIPMCVYATAHGAIFPPAYAGSLEVDPRVVGAAAAFSGFVNFVVVGILTLTLAQWHDGTGFPLAVLCLCGNLIVWSSFLLARRLTRRLQSRCSATTWRGDVTGPHPRCVCVCVCMLPGCGPVCVCACMHAHTRACVRVQKRM